MTEVYDDWIKDYLEQRTELTTLCGLGYTKDKDGNLVELLQDVTIKTLDKQPVKEKVQIKEKKFQFNKIFSFISVLYKYKKRN